MYIPNIVITYYQYCNRYNNIITIKYYTINGSSNRVKILGSFAGRGDFELECSFEGQRRWNRETIICNYSNTTIFSKTRDFRRLQRSESCSTAIMATSWCTNSRYLLKTILALYPCPPGRGIRSWTSLSHNIYHTRLTEIEFLHLYTTTVL